MSSKRDYYEVLGVNRGADDAQLKKAFRQKARIYHPDVSEEPDAEERFKEINEAYAVLSDPQKRAAYDRFGHAGVTGAGQDPFAGFGGFPDLSEIFEAFQGGAFRSSRSRRSPRRGQDLQYRLAVEFEEAIFGTEREIEFERTAICSRCDGNRAEPGTSKERCSHCNGTGEIRRVSQTFLGQMVNISTCPHCKGSGEVVVTPCTECRGQGQVRQTRRLMINIPPGVDEGTQIRYTGEGEPGANNGPPGNLYVVIRVKNHQIFRRRGNDLLITARINVAQATLGHVLDVPALTPQGQITLPLEIPSGTQSGEVFVIKERGVPRLRHNRQHAGYGDLHIMIEVEIPRQLTQEQTDLFYALGETLGEAIIPPAHEKGFFERVIDWLGGE